MDPLDAMEEAIDQALDRYIGDDFRVADVLMAYDGNVTALGRAIADYQGKPFSRGNQDKAVRRWIAYENGVRDRNKSRNPDRDPKTKEMLRALYKKKVRPNRAKAVAQGMIRVSNDSRQRRIDIDPDRNPTIAEIDVDALMDAYQGKDMGAAMEIMFDAYVPGMDMETADNIFIEFS